VKHLDRARYAGPDAVVREVHVPVPVETAFREFHERVARWWPVDFVVGGHAFSLTGIEPRRSGRWFARNGEAEDAAWGEVVEWRPPLRMVLTWPVSASCSLEPGTWASEVAIDFLADGASSTLVRLAHRHFARHGGGAEELRSSMASAGGWQRILAGYRREVG
jgi:hypothetical protein